MHDLGQLQARAGFKPRMQYAVSDLDKRISMLQQGALCACFPAMCGSSKRGRQHCVLCFASRLVITQNEQRS